MALYILRKRIILSFNLKQCNTPPLCSPRSPISLFSFSTSTDRTRATIADYLRQRHQLSPDTVFKLLSSLPNYVRNPENCDSVLLFFKDCGFSTTQIDTMLKRYPPLISADLDQTIKPKIKVFEQVGGLSPIEIVEIFSNNPQLFLRGTDPIRLTIHLLKRAVGDSSPGLFSLLRKCPWFTKSNLEKTMIPNIEFLKTTCGFDDSDIAKFMYLAPRVFLFQHDFFKGCVERSVQMGLQRDSKAFFYGIWSVGSMSVENWERKLELFRSLGCSEDDIRSAFRRAPMVFTTSDRKIKEATEVLLSARNYDISLIVNYPELLIYSVETRLKPRIRVLEVLESKNLLVKKPSMKRWCSMPNDYFLKKYVLPHYAEVGTIYPDKGSTET